MSVDSISDLAPIPSAAQAFAAPAKLNLDLRITGRRADGYHLLESVFTLIDLCDTVYLLPRHDGQMILHTPTAGVAVAQDLAYRAAAALKQASGSPLGVEIWLHKRIPTGGGLGGGSSDAATVLMALNRLWQCGLDKAQLMALGLALGADVPFFIFGENAFARGVGEDLHPLSLPKQWYVIVKPPVHVSTAVVFSHQGLTRNSEASIMPVFQTPQHWRNDMQSVVLFEYPEVKAAFEALAAHGKPMMSGSGACVFLRFESEAAAQAVYQQVSSTHQTYLAANLASHPFYG